MDTSSFTIAAMQLPWLRVGVIPCRERDPGIPPANLEVFRTLLMGGPE